MTSGPAKRGVGRPPKPGGALAALDRLSQEADPQFLARARELFGDSSKNHLMSNPVQAAETLSRDRSVAKALALRKGWQLPHRQQPLREFDPPVCRRETQLAVLGYRGRCQRERKFVLAAADLQSQRHQFVPLSESPARGAATGSDRR